MSMNRRKFLTVSGLAAAAFGVAGKQAVELFAQGRVTDENLVGKRWGMVVDLREFDKDPSLLDVCINSCHSRHNVPDIDTKKHEMKWVWKEEFHHAFVEQENEYLPEGMENRPVLLLCNHCDNPPCVSVCPTQATWRREDGIIMMDWHRCIGCRYCMAGCPYGSRSFNYKDPRPFINEITDEFPTRCKGVVEKCTFCASLIKRQASQGLKPEPYCVAAVRNINPGAMIFGDLNDSGSEIRRALKHNYTIRRKPELGTQPEVYYIVGLGGTE